MLDNSKITNTDELEFAVFCIENIAIKLEKNAEEVYQALTEKSDILSSYIVPEYEMLHTQSKNYIVDDKWLSDRRIPGHHPRTGFLFLKIAR